MALVAAASLAIRRD
ncbi:hypothetical protein ACFQJD_14070 [Haloplanus sp. GCM10025708]